MPVKDLQIRLRYHFKNPALLEEALTHPSFSHLYPEIASAHYERLEFLGDALIGFALAEWLFQHFPEGDEGLLSSAKSSLAKGSVLAKIGHAWGLEAFIRLSPGEKAQRTHHNERIVGSIVEAVIGAIHLDGGMDSAKNVLFEGFAEIFNQPTLTKAQIEGFLQQDNPKGQLQEWFQEKYPNEMLTYTLLEATGLQHKRWYKVAVQRASTSETLGIGEGPSKKLASEKAAALALKTIKI
jgi:ribonuclease-3